MNENYPDYRLEFYNWFAYMHNARELLPDLFGPMKPLSKLTTSLVAPN
jgi:hypothetical protein